MTESSKPRELSEKDKKAMGQFITTCFNLNDPVESFQAHWSKYGFEVACDYLRTEELDAALARIAELEFQLADRSEKYKIAMDKGVDVLSYRIKLLEEAIAKALDHLEVFNFAKDPLRVAYADTELRKALASAREKIGGGT